MMIAPAHRAGSAPLIAAAPKAFLDDLSAERQGTRLDVTSLVRREP